MENNQKTFFEKVKDAFAQPVRLYRRAKNHLTDLRIKVIQRAEEERAQASLSDTEQMQRSGEKLLVADVPEKELPSIENALRENGVPFSIAVHPEHGVKTLVFFEEDEQKVVGAFDRIRSQRTQADKALGGGAAGEKVDTLADKIAAAEAVRQNQSRQPGHRNLIRESITK